MSLLFALLLSCARKEDRPEEEPDTKSESYSHLNGACLSCVDDAPRIAFHFVKAEAKTLSDLKLEDQPFLTEADILSYTWTNHTMSVRSNAIAHLPNMKQVGTGGKAFVIVVDGQRRYRGAFWSSFSSISHFHPVILVDHYNPDRVTIYRMYPAPDPTGKVDVVVDGRKMTIPDPREDKALKRVLKELGKLKEPEAPNNDLQPTK